MYPMEILTMEIELVVMPNYGNEWMTVFLGYIIGL